MSEALEGLEAARPILDAIAHPVVITGSDGCVVLWNRAATELYGYSAEETLGRPVLDILGRPGDAAQREAGLTLAQGRSWTGEMPTPTKSGAVRMMLVTLTPLEVGGATIATAFDTTEAHEDRRRLAEALRLVEQQTETLRHQALHDSLTGLPNRVLLLDRAEQMLARARRDRSRVAALFLDLDDFKSVNDRLGHAAGDQLLRDVAVRLRTGMRESDTLARLGGDEFVLVTDGASHARRLEEVARRLLDSLRAPFALDTHVAEPARETVTASIGVALGSPPSAEVLLHEADLAMYRAKAAGKNRYALFGTDEAATDPPVD